MILQGKEAVPGVAVGKILVYKKEHSVPPDSFVPFGEEGFHYERYLKIKEQAKSELEELKVSMSENPEKAAIFMAQQAIVDDVVINEEIPAKILKEKWTGDRAIYYVYETVIAVLHKAADPLIAERAADFDDVRSLLLSLWYEKKGTGLSELEEPAIIAAAELLPSDTASMDRKNVLAIITESGGVTSHTVIIAKSYNIPTIVGIEGLLDTVKQGQLAVVNADEGEVILDPPPSALDMYIKKSEIIRREKIITDTFLAGASFTQDKTKIEIGLNITNTSDDELKAHKYTDFAGLFRTEFIFMENTLPSEDEQFFAYKKVLLTFGQKPVILRTIDAGADKQIPGVSIPPEKNPFLGNRAIRFCFTHPEIIKTQIKACLRAANHGNLWLMFPMVSSMDDIFKVKKIIESCKNELKKAGTPYGNIKTGIMVEVPSIALIAEHAAKELDFACIGTNDLCQYLCAADRMSSVMEPYYQSYHPALFRLIKETIMTFNKAGKPVSVCGELASDPLAVPVLIGLGLRKLSMGAASIAAVKRRISDFTVQKAEELAEKILQLPSAGDIKRELTAV